MLSAFSGPAWRFQILHQRVKAPARGYPVEVQRMAVALADAGQSAREIREAIIAAVGRAPDTNNMAKLVRRWREAA